jgi:hypothetical protein
VCTMRLGTGAQPPRGIVRYPTCVDGVHQNTLFRIIAGAGVQGGAVSKRRGKGAVSKPRGKGAVSKRRGKGAVSKPRTRQQARQRQQAATAGSVPKRKPRAQTNTSTYLVHVSMLRAALAMLVCGCPPFFFPTENWWFGSKCRKRKRQVSII